ncbi:MAG: hypothetical protein R3E12_19170 [Candidatus Eisenbacteria bacterium]
MDWVRLVNVLAVILLLFPFAWLARVVVGGTESMLCLVWLAASRPTYLLASFAWSDALRSAQRLPSHAPCAAWREAKDETEAHRVRWLLLAGTMALARAHPLVSGCRPRTRDHRPPPFGGRTRLGARCRIACVTGPALVSVTVWVGRNLV